MHAIVTTALLIILLPFVHIQPAAADQIEDAVQAYSRAEYSAAIDLARPLAEAGDSDAQYLMGMASLDGNGVSQSLVEAYMWFEMVVHYGNMRVEQLEQELLSLEGQLGDAVLDRDDVASQLELNQLAEANERAYAWRPGKAP
jgi:TPR repeat protein